MKLNKDHINDNLISQVVEPCCKTMSEVLNNRLIDDNSDFTNAFSELYEPFNIFRYDKSGDEIGYYPIRFCPFCGEQIIIESNNQSAPQD